MTRTLAPVVLLLAVATAAAQTTMPEAVVSSGGAAMSGTHQLRGTVAQAAIGRSVGLNYDLEIGFWTTFRKQVAGAPPPPPAGLVWALPGNHPNPFNPRTDIAYSLPAAGPVTLRVHDLKGAVVATLVDGVVAAGAHTVPWDGRDDRGAAVASGVYFARIVSAHGVLTRKMALVR